MNTTFFDGIEQRPMPVGDLVLDMPCFYADAGATMALFPARMGAVRRLIGDARLTPARLLPGVSVVAVVAYEYRDTPVGSYDEFGIMVPLGSLLRAQLTRRSHWFIHWLPVSRPEADHGADLFGWESGVADMTVSAGSAQLDGLLQMSWRTVKTRERTGKVLTSFMHSGDQLTEVRVNVLEDGVSSRFGAARLQIDRGHPRGRALDEVLLSRRSIALQAMPRSQSILFAPTPKDSRR